MQRFSVGITGISPILMHSPRGVDPTDPLTKQMREITSKRTKKTDSDREEQDWIEFQLALYYNDRFVYVPDSALLGAIRDGAKANRRGKDIQAGVDVAEEHIPLVYDGPREPRELYEARFVDRRPAGVQKARVMRVRPRFNKWALRFELLVDDSIISAPDVKKALEVAGQRSGLLDHRPRFGRFELSQWQEVQ